MALVNFVRGGPGGVPPAVVVNSVPLGFRTLTWTVNRVPFPDSTLTDVLGWWDEILNDTPLLAPGANNPDNPHVRFSVIFHSSFVVNGTWRTVVMNADQFTDADTVRELLEDARPGSDLDNILVDWLQVEVVVRPAHSRHTDRIREREKDEAEAEMEALEEHGDFFAAFEGLEEDEDEDEDKDLDYKHGSLLHGAYDQKRIESAKPAQTLDWYERKKPHLLWPIRNKDNNRCLEYCIALYRKQTRLREKHWRDREQKTERKEEKKLMDAKEMVLAASLSKDDERKACEYARYTGKRSPWSKDALELAELVLGHYVALQDSPRKLEDLVKYHNALGIRFQVFTFDPDGKRARPACAPTWQHPEARELDENAPLISLLYTPPPPGERVGHFDLIPASCDLALNYLGYARDYRFCSICYETYHIPSGHKCSMFCRACGQFGCPNRKAALSGPLIRCDDCHRGFYGQTCFNKHTQPLPSRWSRPLLQTVDAALLQVEVPLDIGAPVGHAPGKPKPRFSMCETIMDCPNCGPGIPRRVLCPGDGEIYQHQCGWEVCLHCKMFAKKEHLCYLQKVEWKEPGISDSYVCMDIECDTRGNHTPYLIRACVGLGTREGQERNLGGYDGAGRYVGSTPEGNYDVDGRSGRQLWFWFEGEGCDVQFIDWCLEKRRQDKKGFTVLAHNGSGYDYAVIYKAIYNCSDVNIRKTVKPIYRGTRLLGISLGSGDTRISFVDFMLHVTGSLGSMIKTFGLRPELLAAGLSLDKENFPHLMHDRTYRGALPLPSFYPSKGNKEEQKKFDDWHVAESKRFWPHPEQPKWDFKQQAYEYNHHDVELLRRAAREFRLESMAATARGDNVGCDPLQYLTTPAACLAVYRCLDLQDHSVPNLPVSLSRIFRRALSGGRVEATDFYWPKANTPPTERLHKIDINSLYPAVQVEFRYPVGYPDEYFGQPTPDQWPAGSRHHQELGAEDDGLDLLDHLLGEERFAFLVVDVVPPDDCRVPVLPLKEQGKNKYTLQPKAQYAGFSPMLRKARQRGYTITKVYGAALWHADHFPPPEQGVWTSYVKRVMQEKDEASGYPADCKTEQQKAEYRRHYNEWPLNHNNELRPDRIENNPGRKAVAKLRANNLWGKFTQKEIYSESRLFRADEIEDFWSLLNDTTLQVQRIVPLNENVLEVSFRKKAPSDNGLDDDEVEMLQTSESPRPNQTAHSVVPGGLVPMYGQLKMLAFMEQIGDQRCYMDTDSLIYRYDPENKDHVFIGGEALGPYLGQFKDELKEDGKDLRITHFGSAGAKNYVLLFDKGPGKSTVKGLPRSRLHPEFQWWFIKASVIAHALNQADQAPEAHEVDITRFIRDRDQQAVRTLPWKLKYQFVNDKVEVFPDGSTLPIGHKDVKAKRTEVERDRDRWEEELAQALNMVKKLRADQDEWDCKERGTWERKQQERKHQRDEQEDARQDRLRMRVNEAGDRLRREAIDQMHEGNDGDDDMLEELYMALEARPHPDMFDNDL